MAKNCQRRAQKGEKMAFNNKSLEKCKENNDLLSAYENYQNTTTRWKNYWWNGVVEIFNACKEFSSRFILDIKNKV